MFRLVEAGFASAGKPDHRDRAPSGFLHFRTADTLRRECRDLGLQIVTHEIELVLVTLFGGMNRRFRRRQREDEPSVASVHRGESENVPEEGTVGLRILAVDDDVRTKNHEPPPSSPMISEVVKKSNSRIRRQPLTPSLSRRERAIEWRDLYVYLLR